MEDASRIAQTLAKAADAYYNTGNAIISDEEFDALKDRLAQLNPKHPFLKQIGAPVVRGASNKAELPYWMGSLDKIRDDPKALLKWKAKYSGVYVISDKLDGISALVVGDKMFTRGDGYVGQDISHVMKMIPALPLEIGADIAVRGELIIRRSNWEKISHMGANARNMVSGFVNAKHPDPYVGANVEFVAYELIHPKRAAPSDGLAELAKLGFNVAHYQIVSDGDCTIPFLSDVLVRRRTDSPYDIDGIVVMHNALHRTVKGKNPSHGFAFKSIMTHDEAEVTVTKVVWNASKDGYLKPLVHFDPITIAGVTISKATGFNAQFIDNNVIGPGARIAVIRSGDVIPHITRVISSASSGSPSFPLDTQYEWNATHVDIVVSKVDDDVRIKQMVHFCKTLEVPYVAEGTLRRMFEAGINTIPKLLAVTIDDLMKIDGFKEKSAERILSGISVIKTMPCAKLMVASNIFGRGLGMKKIESILDAYPYPDTLRRSTVADVSSVPGIGHTTATAFMSKVPEFDQFIGDTKLTCEKSSDESIASLSSTFANMIIVFTGFRNKEWETAVVSRGGKIGSTVTKHTSFIVASDPDESSTKLQKARELGIPIISKDQFQRKLV